MIHSEGVTDSQMPPLLDGLSPLEEAVVDAARRGMWAGPDAAWKVEHLAVTDDPELRVRAELIRELLMGRRGELDPRGVRVRGVRVVGELDLDHITAVTGLAMRACALPDGITCRYAQLRQVFLTEATLIASLHADGLRTDATLSLHKATVTGSDENGALRLLGAHIGGQLNLHGATVTNSAGPALHADRLRTDATLSLQDATIAGAGGDGALRLLGAHIGSQLDFHGVTVTNSTGPALVADNIRIDDILFLRDATITGTGKGALRLVGARVDGQVHLVGTKLNNESGLLLVLVETQASGTLVLPAVLVCRDARLDTGRSPCPDSARQMVVQDLVFPRLGGITWREWLHLLVHHTPDYLPQPYQQLAAVERAAGHDNNARRILIAQQDDLRRRAPHALGGPIARGRHWLWGWLGRYGYRAHRLVTALVVVLVLAGATGYTAGQISTRPGHHVAERVLPPTAPGTPCSTAELIGLGIDRGLPLGATGLRARCDLDTAGRWGQVFTYTLWAIQALLWALATLAIAAYTGLIRKTS